MTYCESAFYKANFSYGEYTARRGTQEARRFWYRWGNPCDRYARRAMKSDRSNKKRDSRVFIRSRLNSVNVNTTDEEIDTILIDCFNSETLCIKWCHYY
jgi:hypothetical protein